MNTALQTGRTVRRTMHIAAEPERVFRALTTKEDLEKWFVRRADVKVPPDGWLRLQWTDTDIVEGPITAYEPPLRFAFEWAEANSPGNSLVSIELHPDGDGTRLELAHSGHGDGDDWDRLFTEHTHGWNIELDHLQRWVESGIEKPWD